MITVGSVFDDNREALSLDWIAGRSGAEKPLTGRDAGSVAAPDLVGHLNLIHPARLHVLGLPEIKYIERMDAGRRAHHRQELMAGRAARPVRPAGPPPTGEHIHGCRNSV